MNDIAPDQGSPARRIDSIACVTWGMARQRDYADTGQNIAFGQQAQPVAIPDEYLPCKQEVASSAVNAAGKVAVVLPEGQLSGGV